MIGTPSIARRIGTGALLMALAASAVACSGGSSNLVDNFAEKVNSSDFQASGTISGSMSFTVSGQKFDVPLSGTIALKGQDSQMSMKMTVLGQETTQDSITVGDKSYSRSGGGAWDVKTKDATEMGINDMLKAAGFVDKGVETHNGQQLHKLASPKPIDPKLLGFGDSISNATVDVFFWARDDGTFAAMTWSGSFDQDQNSMKMPVTMDISFDFNTYSGVTITAPSV
jgi:hypothetical protein